MNYQALKSFSHSPNRFPSKKGSKWVCFLIICWMAASVFGASTPPGLNFTTGPESGDIFREFVFKMNCWGFHPEKQFEVKIDDLQDAIKAEMAVENWGGHVGTSQQRIVINGKANSPVYYPLPKNTPSDPECYHREMYGNAAMEFPLSLLKEGTNKIMFLQDKQICHGWGAPHTLTYALIFRIYYKSTKPHPTGEITSPVNGAVLGPSNTLSAIVKEGGSKIRMVHFIGEYEDFDFEGNGMFRQWHYTYMYGKMARSLGRSTGAPHSLTWKTSKIPDQTKPMKIAAIITDAKGYRYMTPAVTNLTLQRKFSVSLFKAIDVPENFNVRTGAKKGCTIQLTREISDASSVKLILSTWSAKGPIDPATGKPEEPGTTLYINGKKLLNQFGIHHAPSLNIFDVPLDYFQAGAKTCKFEMESPTTHHACEVNWPGPALLATYGDPSAIKAARQSNTDVPSLNLDSHSNGFVYRVNNVGPYVFEVVDLRGRKIKCITGNGPVGKSEIHLPQNLASGVYFGRIISQGEASIRKLCIARP